MKIAICEDEKLCSDILEGYVKKWAMKNGIFVEVHTYTSAEQFLFAVDESFDMLFLDIKMDKMNGVELAYELRERNYKLQIVFTTDLKEYACEGYNVDALNFIFKPVDYEACGKSLDRARKHLSHKKFYMCKTSESLQRILHEDILCIEMISHTAIIKTKETTYKTRRTISEIIRELDNELFVRCHKSFIVNIQHISSISKKSIVLSNGSEIDVGNVFVSEVNEKFIKYNKNRR